MGASAAAIHTKSGVPANGRSSYPVSAGGQKRKMNARATHMSVETQIATERTPRARSATSGLALDPGVVTSGLAGTWAESGATALDSSGMPRQYWRAAEPTSVDA